MSKNILKRVLVTFALLLTTLTAQDKVDASSISSLKSAIEAARQAKAAAERAATLERYLSLNDASAINQAASQAANNARAKMELYSGTTAQNIKLFKVRPTLRGKTFSIRMLAWDKEFGEQKEVMSYKKNSTQFSLPLYQKQKERKKNIYDTILKKEKWILPSGVTFRESFGLFVGLYGAGYSLNSGYVSLGKNIAIASLVRFFYKWGSSNEINNLEYAKVWLEYFPLGSTSSSSEIIAGEVGNITLYLKNTSNIKKIRNIKPKLELDRSSVGTIEFPVHLKFKSNSKKSNPLTKKFVILPNETIMLDYELSMPNVYDRKMVKLDGSFLDHQRVGYAKNPVFSVIDSPEPPELILVIKEFNDSDGNGVLDGLESATIIGVLENKGLGIARNPTIVLRKKPINIIFDEESRMLEDIYPGKKKVFNFKIKGGSQLSSGESSFEFFASDGRGYEARPEQVTIPTSKFLPPTFKLTSWTINDGKIGMADGNNNGLVENGESVEILLTIRNEGSGPAYGSKIAVSMQEFGVVPIQNFMFIGAIGPESEIIVPIGFRVPVTFKKEMFSFSIHVEDERKATSYRESIKIESEYRFPEISFDFIVHDGTTSGSKGNRNGLIEQGEMIELEILTENNGDFEAEDVTLKINYDHPGVSMKANSSVGGVSFPIGFIPAKQYGRKQIIPFDIKYTAEVGDFELTVIIDLANFNGIREKINFEIYEYSSNGIALGARGTSNFGNTSSQNVADWINVDNPPQFKNELKNGFAVVIGNRNYENRDIPQVEYADRDSRIFKTYLTNTIGLSSNKILYKKDAKLSDFNRIFGTKENKQGQLYKQVKNLGKNVKVFIFYSGHGAPDLNTNKAYIVPSEASMGNIEFEGYPLEQLLESLGNLPTNDVTLVIDACFSGKTEKEMLYKNISPALLKVKSPRVVRGLNVFSSSKNDQVSSWYPKARHGVFSYYFFAGMQGNADLNLDGKITNGEMFSYLEEKVPSKVNELSDFSREQTPTFVGNKNSILIQSYK